MQSNYISRTSICEIYVLLFSVTCVTFVQNQTKLRLQIAGQMNHALPNLEAVDISFIKERLFLHHIQMFVLCDWRRNIVIVIGIWYISAKCESSISFRISFNDIAWTEAKFLLRFINFWSNNNKFWVQSVDLSYPNNYGNVHNKQKHVIRMHTK